MKEGVFALCVRLDAASQLEFAAGLQIVDAVGLRLPDVERRARDGLALDRQHPAADPDVLPLHGRPFAQVAAVSVLLRAVRKEGPEHGGFGRAGLGLVVDRHRHHRQAEDVGEQDELLALAVAFLPDRGEEPDRLEPFLLGELHVLRERVQVPDQAGHQLLDAGILDVFQPGDDRLGQVVFGELPHWSFLLLWSRPQVYSQNL